MVRYFRLTIFLCVALVTTGVSAGDSYLELDDFVTQALEGSDVASISLTVIEQGEIVHEASHGFNDYHTREITEVNTIYQVGSVSKAVAAWGVMRLVDAGEIELDKPINEYLTRWQIKSDEYDINEVTVRRVLSHSAGLSTPSYAGFSPELPLPTIEESLDGASNGSPPLTMSYEPGAAFRYSGGGYTLLQLLIEEVSGQSFSDYIHRHILQPLNMQQSSFAEADVIGKSSSPHDFHLNVIPAKHFRAEAAASLRTTSSDLARFLIANTRDNTVLSAESRKLMQTAVVPVSSTTDMGLGLFLEQKGRLIGHGGSNPGWKAKAFITPDGQHGLAVLSNSESGSEIVDDVFCQWDALNGMGLLQKECEQKFDERDRLIQIGWGVAILFAALTAWLVRIILSKRQRGSLISIPPSGGMKIAIFGLCLVTLTGLLVFGYTGVGVELMAGIPWGFKLVDFFPMSVKIAFLSLCLLVTASCLLQCMDQPSRE